MTLEEAQILDYLSRFINPWQLSVLKANLRGEEGEFFYAMLREWRDKIEAMPKSYEQDGKGDEAVVHLHYFKNACDWHITEKDREEPDHPGQHQAFGLCNLGYGGELGYVSIVELMCVGAEFDLYWEPKTLGEIKK